MHCSTAANKDIVQLLCNCSWWDLSLFNGHPQFLNWFELLSDHNVVLCCVMLCEVTLTIPLSAQRCNIYELQQTATVSNCLGNSSIPHCALVNYYKIENFFCIHLCIDQANQGGSTTINFKDHKYCQMGVSLAHLKVRFYCKP